MENPVIVSMMFYKLELKQRQMKLWGEYKLFSHVDSDVWRLLKLTTLLYICMKHQGSDGH